MDENTFFTKDGNLKEKIEIPDYFILFNLQKKYSLDAKELEQSFEDWMLQLHPDLFVTAHRNSEKPQFKILCNSKTSQRYSFQSIPKSNLSLRFNL